MPSLSPEPSDAEQRPAAHRRAIFWGIVVAAVATATLIALALSEDPPPERIVIAAGDREGAYYAYGRELSELIRQQRGPEVVVETTGGSVDNLKRLADRRADVAFVQSGVATAAKLTEDLSGLRSIARIYSEPLWIFHDRDRPIERLTSLKQARIAIGAKGSGTQPVALDVLAENGITRDNATLLELETSEAVSRFRQQKLDALFMVASPAADAVQSLLRDPDVRVMSFSRHHAYTKRLPYLATVEIPPGLVSLREDLPRRSLLLLAPTATLVTRKDVHPRIVERVMSAATGLFGPGNLIDDSGRFPSGDKLELAQHEAAQRYMREGESWISRNLPFPAVRLMSRAKLLLIPLVALLIPLFRFLPALLQVRLRRLLKLHYESLRDAEARILSAETQEQLEAEIESLLQLRNDLARLSRRVPGTYQDTVYQWRVHVNLVREEALERLETMRASTPASCNYF